MALAVLSPVLQAISSIGGLIFPAVFDFAKKKFLKPKQDTPQATISALATTKPEVIDKYVNAQAALLEAQTKYFNRDVYGEISRWVGNLRAVIRPGFVAYSCVFKILAHYFGWTVDVGTQCMMDTCITSWFGSRFIK